MISKHELGKHERVIAYHPRYFEHFQRTQQFILKGDGPLPYDYRYFLAILAAARHKCTYLIEIYQREFLLHGGNSEWLNGIEYAPIKLKAIYEINKLLAHRPWLLKKEHFESLTKGKNSWSVSELVHAIVLLAHFHSLSSFVFSCGLTQQLDETKIIQVASGTSEMQRQSTIESIMQRMKFLSQKQDECSESELRYRFKDVEMQTAQLSAMRNDNPSLNAEIVQYIRDPDFTYQDFAKRGCENIPSTFRIQDYSWDDHGYSLINELYDRVGFLLDDKFRVAYNLTYFSMAGIKDVDTSKFRRAIWNYIQCIYGIRHDDYDYGEVNQLLDRSLKMFIKTACCFPERITKEDYDNILVGLLDSEKVHINLMIMEAKNQAELLYALREVMVYMT